MVFACFFFSRVRSVNALVITGIVTAGEVISASAEVFNMGADLAAVLVAGAVALNGDITTLTFSIGGADAREHHLFHVLKDGVS